MYCPSREDSSKCHIPSSERDRCVSGMRKKTQEHHNNSTPQQNKQNNTRQDTQKNMFDHRVDCHRHGLCMVQPPALFLTLGKVNGARIDRFSVGEGCSENRIQRRLIFMVVQEITNCGRRTLCEFLIGPQFET